MDPMEVFKIEVTGGEEYGAKKYREIIMDILQDLGLIRSIAGFMSMSTFQFQSSQSTASSVPAYRPLRSRMWEM